MAQGELFTAALDQFQKLCGALVVGKVSPHALDAGAQIVGVGPAAQHVQVVVAFQRHKVAAGKRLVHRRGQGAKVGGDGHGLIVRGMNAVAYAGYIVAGGEGLYPEAADVLFPALQRVQLTVGGHDIVGVQKIQRSRCAVHRHRVLFQESGKPLDVVAVLVGDKDARAIADGKPQRFERCRGGAYALAHIHDEVLRTAAHHAAVAGGAGIQ